jgi:hypothetical protein
MRVFSAIVVVALLAAAATPAPAGPPYLQVYFGVSHGDSVYAIQSCPGYGVLDTLYVVAHDFDAYVLGIEYQVSLPPTITFIADLDLAPVVLGSSTTGISMAWSVPRNGYQPLLVQRILVMYTCTGCGIPNATISVQPYPPTGDPYPRVVTWPSMSFGGAVDGSELDRWSALCSTICPSYDCSIDPLTIDFGTVPVGAAKDTTFTIDNASWCTDATFSGDVSVNSTHFSVVGGGGPFQVDWDEAVDVTVRFEPASEGAKSAIVETGQDICRDVLVTGTALGPVAVVDPDTLLFGVIDPGDTVYADFTIANAGGDTLRGTISEVCDDYHVTSGAGPFALAGGEDIVVTVRFAPGGTGWSDCVVETGSPICPDVFCRGAVPTGVADRAPAFVLHPNYPNPFSQATVIAYELHRASDVRLEIFDIAGRRVRTIVERRMAPGTYQQPWDGRDARGRIVASGIYFYRLHVGEAVLTRKLVVVR